MKNVLLALALFVSMQAHAGLGFEGKYKGIQGTCAEFSRVYVTLGQSAWGPSGAMALVIKMYGEDASQDEILLGSGQRQAPGTSVKAHGVVTESWVTKVQGSVLVSDTVVVRPSIGLRYGTHTTVIGQGNRLTIEHTSLDAGGKANDVRKCVLERN